MSGAREYFLKTERLGFSCWTSEDFPLAQGLWGDPEVARFLGGPFTDQQIHQRLERHMALLRDYNVQYWPIFLRETGDHVGCGGLQPYRIDEGIYELGFHLHRAYWGRGLAEEAARAVIGYAFESLGLETLFAGHHPENAASRRVLERLGFQYAGEDVYPPSGMLEPTYFLHKLKK
ncbi:MAG TPA: GNAT family N-acetyltransferase [Bryobacteraceae bacterium]|nr:GNAT family N-acetyltransferase [Bryobacteraceae bacterium]